MQSDVQTDAKHLMLSKAAQKRSFHQKQMWQEIKVDWILIHFPQT